MSLVDQARTHMRAVPVFTHPAALSWSGEDEYTSDSYGDYLATSNDVYATAWLRAKMLAKLPWQAFKTDGAEYEAHPILSLLNRPNPHFTALKMKAHLELCMAIWGQAYVTIERNARGVPVELWPVKPTMMSPVRDRNEFIRGYLFYPPDGGAPIPFTEDEVIWIAYPNPQDWYAALPPMGAARLAADIASAAQKANRNLFTQGMMAGGFVLPPAGSTLTLEQATDLENLFDRRARGVEKAHRWAFFQHEFQAKQMSITPKDAEFIEGLNISFRQVCRAIGVPPALVGDAQYATLANLRVYERLFWEQTGEFEADYVAAEFTRQLVPSYPNVDHVALNLDDVVALQEDESERWGREKEQITGGAKTINEWRLENGYETVAWGDAWWALATLLPVSSASSISVFEQDPARLAVRGRAFDRLTDRLATDLRGYFDRLRDDVLRRIKEGQSEAPFDQTVWDPRAADAALPGLLGIMESSFDQASDEIRGTRDKGALRRKATLRAGVLAGEMNTTTFKNLRLALRKILDEGGTVDDLVAEVNRIMRAARETRARLIAESETTGAVTDGQLEAWTAFPAEIRKRWVTAHDEKVRSSHAALDGTSVGLDEGFFVGGCSGPGPGRTGCAGEDINCRCVLAPVLAEPRTHVPPETGMLHAVIGALE